VFILFFSIYLLARALQALNDPYYQQEAFRATALRPKFGTFQDESSPFGNY